jgi:hypothetical protein
MWGETENFMVPHIFLAIKTIAMPLVLDDPQQTKIDEYNSSMKLMHGSWSATLEKFEARFLAAAATC